MTHLRIHPRDRAAWGRPTICGKFRAKTDRAITSGNLLEVDCSTCRFWIEGWSPALVLEMFENSVRI